MKVCRELKHLTVVLEKMYLGLDYTTGFHVLDFDFCVVLSIFKGKNMRQ